MSDKSKKKQGANPAAPAPEAAAAPAAPQEKADGKKPQGELIFALDIGTRTVVGVLVESTAKGLHAVDMQAAEHEKRSMADGQIEDIEAVAEVIRSVKSALEGRNGVELRRVCVAAAGRALKTKRASWEHTFSPDTPITAEDVRAVELEAVRKTEQQFMDENDTNAFYCVGHSIISLDLDGFKVTKPEGHRGEKLTTELIAAFLPSYVVEGLCAAIDAAELEVAGMTLEPIAAMNAIIPQELRLLNLALCDIGAGTSDIAVSRDGSVVAYGMATTAGDEITETLMKRLLVDFATAERIKTSDEQTIEYTDILLRKNTITAEKVKELVRPAAEDLASVLAAEVLSANGTAPQAVFLVGGGSKLKGLAKYTAEALGMDEQSVVVGTRELLRGINLPDEMSAGTEHTTPFGIAMTAGTGVSYDFTTIKLNGKKIKTLNTKRLTVFELLGIAGIRLESLMAASGAPLSFTVDGAKVLLRGTPPEPAVITINGEPASLNKAVNKGDDVVVKLAENGENASARLSDYADIESFSDISVELLGDIVPAGRYALVNGRKALTDRSIKNGDDIQLCSANTLRELLKLNGESRPVLLNGRKVSPETELMDGDVITLAEDKATKPAPKPAKPAPEAPQKEAKKQEETKTPAPSPDKEATKTAAETAQPASKTPAEKSGITITINGITAEFPAREDGKPVIFLDVAAAFADEPSGLGDPTALLSHSSTITLNGKIARLDEEIHDGDVIVIC